MFNGKLYDVERRVVRPDDAVRYVRATGEVTFNGVGVPLRIMVYADVDRMKWINDNLGHEEGDAALIEAATVLKETFREADIIGRVGGDEFAVLATETGSEVALGDLTLLLKERLTKITAGHNAASGRKYQLSMSIGVKRCGPGCCHSVNELLNQADQLMYEDKRQRGVGR